MVVRTLPEYEDVSVIGKILAFHRTGNENGAMGSTILPREVLIVLTIIMIAAVLVFVFLQKEKSVWLLSGVCLIVAGGIGNLIDRIATGVVIDFIKVIYFPWIFNVADICVCVGAVLLCIAILLMPDTKRGEEDGGDI